MRVQPKVSVIIPVYNVELYLRECLDSVLTQTLNDFEVICVDDGSTDGSLKILREYEKRDTRLTVIAQANYGVSYSRNVGLSHAQGQYVIFVDADDYVESTMLEILWREIEANESDIVVFGGDSFPSIGWVDRSMTVRSVRYRNNSIRALLYETGSRPFMCNKIYRRALIEENGLRLATELSLGEDQAFQFVIFPMAERISFLPDHLYHYRQGRPGSAMVQAEKDLNTKIQEHLKLAEYILRDWIASGTMAGHERDWAWWCLNFLYADILRVSYNLSCRAADKIIAWFIELGATEQLAREDRKKYDDLSELSASRIAPPKISVIIPVYNSEAYLEQCLSSVCAQTLREFEVICVDDGSTDASVDMIKAFAQRDCRITLLTQEHKFAGAARNLGIAHARGEYLLFLDSDDFFQPDMLQKVYDRTRAFDADICVFRADFYDHQTGKFTLQPWTCDVDIVPRDVTFSRIDAARNLYSFTSPAPWTKLFRRTFVLDEKLFFQQTRSANDLKFVLLALSTARSIVTLDAYLVHYRVNTGTSLQATQHKDPLAFYQALDQLKAELTSRGLYEELEQSYLNFALDCCLYNLSTLKDRRAFEFVYFQLRDRIFPELGVNGRDKDYFYAYPGNRIFEKREDINRLAILEYVDKYGYFRPVPPAPTLETVQYRPDPAVERELQAVQASWSYRIGRGMTFFPRKLRGGVRCLKEHGGKYTISRLFEKISAKLH